MSLAVTTVPGIPVSATVYHSQLSGDYSGYEGYYFCCNACGACGRHTLSHQVALDEAVWHVLHANHKEEDHGRVQGQEAH